MNMKKLISLLLSVVFVTTCLVSAGFTTVFAADYENLFDREKYYEESMTAYSEFDLSDRNTVTDEEFFGVFDGTTWTTPSIFDYEKYTGLAAVEAAAKEGKYSVCREELLKYYQQKYRKYKLSRPGGTNLDERTRVQYETIFDNVFFDDYAADTVGRITFNNENAWRPMDFTEEVKRVAKGSKYASETKIKYNLLAAKKDGYMIEIDSRETEFVPYIEVLVNGTYRTFYATADTYMVKGNATTNYGGENKLLVEESVSSIGSSAKPVDDNTKVALIMFDFAGLTPTDQITSATLYLHGRMVQSTAPGGVRVPSDVKNVYVKSWQIDTTPLDEYSMNYSKYESSGDCYLNFDGEMGPYFTSTGKHQLKGSIELIGMRGYLDEAYNGYMATGEEIFAYHFIRVMLACIHAQGGYDDWVYYFNLDPLTYYMFQVAMVTGTTARWVVDIALSESMTPEAWTTIVKHYYLCGNFIVENWDSLGESNNYGVHYTSGLGNVALFFNEFDVVDDPLGPVRDPEMPGSVTGGFLEVVKFRLAYKILKDFKEDGQSVEVATNYAIDTIMSALGHTETTTMVGESPTLFYSDELLDRLLLACQWQLYHLNPRFGDWQTGDGGTWNTQYQNRFKQALALVDEEDYPELLWAASLRTKGTAPEILTKVNDDPGKVTFRNSWEANAVAARLENTAGTLVSKGYSHGHNDDLSLTVAAYGGQLLVDPLMGNYTVTEANERWLSSTRGHNTIEINDTIALGHKYYSTQEPTDLFGEPMHTPFTQYGKLMGTLHPENREINTTYDFVRGETFGYTDNNALESDYQVLRDVLFLHDGYLVVTDYINPEDPTKENHYTQPWHVLPDANISVDAEAYTARTNFDGGANVVVATVKKDTIQAPAIKDGVYARGKNNFVQAPYPYFEQVNTGITTFSTLIYPTQPGKTANVTTVELPLDIPDTKANAFRANVVDQESKSVKQVNYYTLFDESKKAERVFGDYTTDGVLALTDAKDGIYNFVVLRKGTQIKINNTDEYLVYATEQVEDLGVEWKDDALYLSSSKLTDPEDALLDKITVNAAQTVSGAYLNGEAIEFAQEGRYIYFGDTPVIDDADYVAPEDENASNKPPVHAPSNPGPSAPSPADKPPVVDNPIVTPPVSDEPDFDAEIKGHWAEAEIKSLLEDGVVTGKDDTLGLADSVTRAEFVTMLVRALGLEQADYDGAFSDVAEGSWYAGYIATARANGWIEGDGVAAHPDRNITREEMTKILTLACEQKYGTIEGDRDVEFTDETNVSSWALTYLDKAVLAGLITGMDDGSFMPKQNAKREQAMVMVYRLLNFAK